jgi:hypothetical protein
MLKRNIFFAINVAVILTVSCTKTLNIDIPGGDNQLVINATLCPDSAISLTLSKSKNVLDVSNIEYLNEANILVYENNLLVDTLVDKGNGLYRGNLKPSINRTYTIKVKTINYGSAECSDSVPEKVKIQKIDTALLNNPLSRLLNCTISFEDPADKENYYILKVFSADRTDPKNLQKQKYTCYNISDYIGSMDGGNITFFSDIPFNGKIYSILVSMLYPNNKILYFQLWSINQALYNYSSSIAVNRYSNSDIFDEKTKVQSNIKGGLGILGAYCIATDTIVVM